jgi:hypothetical protein
MEIYKIFDMDFFSDSNEIDLLKKEITHYLKKIEMNQDEVLSERSNFTQFSTVPGDFYREKERTENISQTLQYLLTYLTHIPGNAEIDAELFNQVEQFREFIRYQVGLLLEGDVQKAVYKEFKHMGSVGDGSTSDYQERIFDKYRELIEQIAKDESDVGRTILTLCQVLEQLSLFWFEVRRGDMRRTRHSDIYQYLLARIVQNRCQNPNRGQITVC